MSREMKTQNQSIWNLAITNNYRIDFFETNANRRYKCIFSKMWDRKKQHGLASLPGEQPATPQFFDGRIFGMKKMTLMEYIGILMSQVTVGLWLPWLFRWDQSKIITIFALCKLKQLKQVERLKHLRQVSGHGHRGVMMCNGEASTGIDWHRLAQCIIMYHRYSSVSLGHFQLFYSHSGHSHTLGEILACYSSRARYVGCHGRGENVCLSVRCSGVFGVWLRALCMKAIPW